MGFHRKPARDTEDFKVRRSYLLIYKIFSLVAADDPLGVHKCTTFQNTKSKESYLREFENRASLSATASSDSRITSTTISATLVQVLPGVGQHYCVDTDSL